VMVCQVCVFGRKYRKELATHTITGARIPPQRPINVPSII
jgi:hypothetical protein